VAIWGPRIAFEPPSDTTWRLLVADETGLPALGSICESLPADTKVRAIVEVTDEYDELPFESAASLDVQWIHRGAAAVGTTDLLADAVRELAFPEGEQVYAWGGGEIRAMNEIRHHLRKERGLSKDQVSVLAYWRHTSHVEDDRDVSEA
jgi:NADPH-dependent ferric siderophore reductase